MKKNTLIFIPTGLSSPEIEILVATAQEELDKKKHLVLLVCRGGKNYACSKNILSIPNICKLCIHKRTKMINNLKGKYQIFETPELKNANKYKKFTSFQKLKNYNFKGMDNGLGAYSSYLDHSRDKDLQGFFADNIIARLIHTTDRLTEFYSSFLKNKKINNYFAFNSRMNLQRPLFRLAEKLKIKINNLESTHDGRQAIVHNFKDSMVNDYDKLPKLINKYWNSKNKLNKKNVVEKYYSNVKGFSSHMENPSGFLKAQKQGLLPKVWDKNKFNISFFVSSEDEYESIIKKKDDSIFKNQLDSIVEISTIIENKKDFAFYIRMHPNLSNVNWSYVKDIVNLKNIYENTKVIDAQSKISTHTLMQNSDLVVGLKSRTLLEATYIKKPTIILGNSFWQILGPFLTITSRAQLKKIIL